MFSVQNTSNSYGINIGGYNNKNKAVFAGKMQSPGKLETSGAFAADIINRIKTNPAPAQQTEQQKHEADYAQMGAEQKANNPKDLRGLQTSLENTINYVAKQHGSQAATTVMGIVYQNVGMGNVTEESLGQGFMQAIKFVDRNFGISQGNKLMDELNQNVNKEMNEYFDNGQNEVFFDATDPRSALRTAKGIMESMDKMLDKAIDNIESPEIDLGELGKAAKKMREQNMKALAKKMIQQGELPPAYTQEYLTNDIPGQLLNTEI